MTFASDNWAGACDKVMEALAAVNTGLAPSYGADPATAQAREALSAYFEKEVAAFFVSTGSAANALAVASYSRPGGVVFCHVDAHLSRDEAGAPALAAPGLALDLLDGPRGMIDPDAFRRRLSAYPEGVVHHGQPALVSLTNVNEIGQCYGPREVSEIAMIAKERGMAVHMDGARFSNAIAHLGVTPAELTWRAGVDVLSLGLTKAGAWCAEVVVFFDPAMRRDVSYRHKQYAQLLSKNRFVAAQVSAMLKDKLAINLARHANRMASAVAEVLSASGKAQLVYSPQSNEVFAYLSPAALDALVEVGIKTGGWMSDSKTLPGPRSPDWTMQRFVASFRTTDTDVALLKDALAA
ncbi:beta-eliminating lyase-related protein [Acuticoccus sp. M5D2P5]|uniref:threonine aldolase family protein n=1 Tax=Acuticoccus kalidii TaxID=2910977 RepID=UPI001F168FD6|nr:beta-eliminating lyase-related protein [Acuticoccus kalidii]MCF3935799.1 beta-eliminating lyase-related protein [Acuticoccus kalidii]